MATLATTIEGISAVGAADVHVRLWKAYFRSVSETDVLATLQILSNGVLVTNDSWLSKWEGILSQLNRCGIAGPAIRAGFVFLGTTLNGNEILTLFNSLNTGGLAAVHAEGTFALVVNLHAGGLTGTQIVATVNSCLTTLQLHPNEAVSGIGTLRTKGLTGLQVVAVIAALCGGGLAASRSRARVVALLNSVGASTRTAADINTFFTLAQAPLTVAQAIEVAWDLRFNRMCELLLTVGAAAALHSAFGACGNSIDRLRDILLQAQTSAIPVVDLIVLLNAVQHVPGAAITLRGRQAHTRTGRVVEFISQAAAAKTNVHVNGRDWAGIVGLIAAFRGANRMPLGALADPGGRSYTVRGATLRCTGARFIYFLRAHTLQYCSFQLADRTKDDITLWSGNAHTPGTMQGLVNHMVVTDPDDLKEVMDDATESVAQLSVQFVGDCEAGIVKNPDGSYQLLHFMPNNLYLNVVVIHKDLLFALGYMLALAGDA